MQRFKSPGSTQRFLSTHRRCFHSAAGPRRMKCRHWKACLLATPGIDQRVRITAHLTLSTR